MLNRRLLLLVAILAACKPAPKQPATPGAEPKVAATVVSVRTTIGEQTSNHDIVIVGGRARNTGEIDVWRLFDTKAGTVTFVDDVGKTFRTEPMETMTVRRRAALAAAVPGHFPRAKLTRGPRRTILNVDTQQAVIELGAYRRELWIGEHPSIPGGLFAMMLASDAPSSPLAPVMQRVDEELLRVRGFPLVDKAEVPIGKTRSVVERAVVSIASKQVAETTLAIPKDYRDLTPKPAPAKR